VIDRSVYESKQSSVSAITLSLAFCVRNTAAVSLVANRNPLTHTLLSHTNNTFFLLQLCLTECCTIENVRINTLIFSTPCMQSNAKCEPKRVSYLTATNNCAIEWATVERRVCGEVHRQRVGEGGVEWREVFVNEMQS
jgi:hypothetical protein